MRILITNDDGVFAEGLRILASWARKLGEVTVVAPKNERSATSHSINIHTPFEVVKVDIGIEGVEAFSVDSTPADCVSFALFGLYREFDLVLSGINRGMNLGNDIGYSGTCAACFEASYHGLKSIAFSTFPASFTSAEKQLDRVWAFIEENSLLSFSNIYNVNIPTVCEGIRITRHGDASIKATFKETSENMYQAVGEYTFKGTCDLETDRDAAYNNFISISPLTHDTTDWKAFSSLKDQKIGQM